MDVNVALTINNLKRHKNHHCPHFQTAWPRTLCWRRRCPRRSLGLPVSWSLPSPLLTFWSPLIKLYQNFSRENSWRGDVTGYVTQSPFNPNCRFCKRNQLLTRKAVTYHGVITPNLIFIIQSKWNETFKSKILLKLSSTVLWEI